MIKFLSPPEFDDKETTLRAQIFFKLVIGSAIIVTFVDVFELVILPQNFQRWIFIICTFNILSLGLLILNRKGKTRTASYIFAGVLIALIFGLAWSAGGIKAASIQQIPIIVLAVGLILGWKEGALCAASAIVACIVLVVAEHVGILPVSYVTQTSLSVLVNLTMQVGLLVLLQYLIVGNLDKTLREAKDEVALRKQAEESLQQSEERFRLILDNMPILLNAFDERGMFIVWNKACEDASGYSAHEIIGNPKAMELLYPDRAYRTRVWNSSIDPGNKENVYDLVNKNGERRTIEWFDIYHRFKIQGWASWGMGQDITERKRAEEALRESEERMRAIVEGTPHLFFYRQDAEANTTYVSPTVERITGYNVDTWLKRKDWFVTDAKTNQAAKEKTHAHLQGEYTKDSAFIEIRHANGDPILLEAYEYPIIKNGKVIGLQGVAHNITERNRAEEALRFERLLLRTLIDNIPDSIYSKDMSSRKTLANLAEVRNLRVQSEADVLGKDDFELYPKELADGFFADDQSVLQTGRPVLNKEECIYDEKGEKRWLLTSKLPLRDKEGRTIGLVGIGRDITARKRAEDQLRKLSLAVEQSPTSIVITDIHGRIEYVNPKFTQVTGYAIEEVLGKNPSILKSGETSADEYKNMWESITAGNAWRGEFHNKKKNGELFWEMASISPVKDQDNIIVNFVAVKEDITERKQVEEALRQAQKLESIGTLAGGIAHDFNNLLNAILGQSTLAINKLSKENPAKDHIEKSIKAAERAADLTRHLLAYSGKGKFVTEEIDLNRLVEENIQMLEVSIPKTVQLLFHLDSPSPHIQGDVGQVQQVIMNLIINAGEAIAPNPGSITVRSRRIEITKNDTEFWKYTDSPLVPGSYASLQVNDTGHGIKPEMLARIFDPFFTTKFTGRGLGLAAVLGIVRGHHGGLRIESKEGKGTEFEVVFPLVDASTVAAVTELKASSGINGGGKTILVIDDEPSILELLNDVFTDANFKVMEALNPMEGITLYREHNREIQLVILDYSMPGMDGKAAFEELVKIKKDVKVILCSGYTEEEIKSAFGDIHPLAFIQKPYKPTKLLEVIVGILGEKDSRTGRPS